MLKYFRQFIFYIVMEILKQQKFPEDRLLRNIIAGSPDGSSGQNHILASDCGIISYSRAYELQVQIFEAVKSRSLPGVILLLEHRPVITAGSNKNFRNLLIGKEKLQRQGIELAQSDRGGDITLHSPGQVVCYTIINLAAFGKDLSLFVYNLEEVLIDILKKFKIPSTRIKGHRGVFSDEQKIASIGLKVRKWITFHGFSLNVNNDLKYFDYIIACGLRNYPQTSMKKILKRSVDISGVKEGIVKSFGDIFKIPVKKI